MHNALSTVYNQCFSWFGGEYTRLWEFQALVWIESFDDLSFCIKALQFKIFRNGSVGNAGYADF